MIPKRYLSGLSKTKKAQRKKEIAHFGAIDWKSPAAYVGFSTNRGRKTRKSHYSTDWAKQFPHAKSLTERAEVTGVPIRFIRESYNRGMAAWRTGHRPGATQQQWGYARVSSMLLCGKTYHTTDADIVKRAIHASSSAKRWFAACSN